MPIVLAADSVPFGVTLLISAAMIAGAIAIIVITNKAASGSIPPNRGIGIRTTATRSSPEAWQAAHRAARPFVQFGAIALFVSGGVVLALSTAPTALFGVAIVGTVLMAIALVAGAIVADRAAKEVIADS